MKVTIKCKISKIYLDFFFPPLGLMIILAFLVFEFSVSFLAMVPKMLYVIMVEFAVSVEGSLFFKLKQIFGGR